MLSKFNAMYWVWSNMHAMPVSSSVFIQRTQSFKHVSNLLILLSSCIFSVLMCISSNKITILQPKKSFQSHSHLFQSTIKFTTKANKTKCDEHWCVFLLLLLVQSIKSNPEINHCDQRFPWFLLFLFLVCLLYLNVLISSLWGLTWKVLFCILSEWKRFSWTCVRWNDENACTLTLTNIVRMTYHICKENYSSSLFFLWESHWCDYLTTVT